MQYSHNSSALFLSFEAKPRTAICGICFGSTKRRVPGTSKVRPTATIYIRQCERPPWDLCWTPFRTCSVVSTSDLIPKWAASESRACGIDIRIEMVGEHVPLLEIITLARYVVYIGAVAMVLVVIIIASESGLVGLDVELRSYSCRAACYVAAGGCSNAQVDWRTVCYRSMRL